MYKPHYHFHINLKYPVRLDFPGDWTGVAKGRGYEFWQLREYQKGDDVFLIDWKAKARHRKLHVREYLQETFYNLMLCCDVSPSMFFGKKFELMKDISTSLAHAALKDNNSCGLLLFANNIIRYIPPSAKYSQYARITNELNNMPKPEQGKTSLQPAFRYLSAVAPNCFAIFLSDFILDTRETKLLSREVLKGMSKHELASIHILEDVEYNFSSELDSIVSVRNNESGERMTLDLGRAKDRELHNRYEKMKKQLTKFGIDSVLVKTSDCDIEQNINSFLTRRSHVKK